MEPQRRKVTTKALPTNIKSPSVSTATSPSVSSSTPIVVRAKISSTARTRTQSTTSSPAAISVPSKQNGNVVLQPQSRGTSRRSPSPAKMMMRSPSPSKMIRPLSPFKQLSQSKPVVRTTLSKASPAPARASSRSHVSTVFGSSDAISSSISAPSTPIPRVPSNNWDADENPSKISSNSLRIKAKVSSLAKPGLPSLSTVVSPPSPTEISPTLFSPTLARPTRVRAATATRRPSVTFSVTHRATSPSRGANVRIDNAQLVPLPTSPPASNLSFSSHSSTSASASSIPTTSDKTTPPPSHINHSRRVSAQANTSFRNLSAVNEQELIEGPSSRPSSPSRRPLVARVRPGTRISGGLGDWSSGSSLMNGRNQPSHLVQQDDSTSDSDSGSDANDNATKRPAVRRTASQEREDEERAEAKSSRKIADLEITTRSLLAINGALEASKIRQAREIRELRRKLREVRLSMPPKQFKLLPEKDRSDILGEESEDHADESDHFEEEQEKDEDFRRVKNLIEELLMMGRSALAVPAPSFAFGQAGMLSSGNQDGEVLGWDAPSSVGPEKIRGWKHGVAIGTRVLSAEEAKKWVGGEEDGNDSQGELAEEDEVERQLGSVETEVVTITTSGNRPGIPSNDNILS